MVEQDSLAGDSTRGLRGLAGHALLGPLFLFLSAAAAVLVMGAHLFGTPAVGMLAWGLGFVAIGVGASMRPVFFLALLGFSCTTLPYLEPAFSVGKQLPLLLAIAVTLGCALGLGKAFLDAAGGRLGRVARPVAVFGNLMLVSAVITTLRYSPLVAEWISSEAFDSFSRVGTAGIQGGTTNFLLRAAGLAVGPTMAIAIMHLGDSANHRRVSVDRVSTWLLGSLLSGLGLSLLVCLGQAALPGFPLPTRDPRWPTGLMTNPGALATLIAMLSPVVLGIVLYRRLPAWIRWVAASDLVLAIAALGPLDSKTGQVGIIVGPVLLAGLLVIGRVRARGGRKVLVAALVIVAGTSLALAVHALAAASVSDWDRFVSEGNFGFRPARLERNRQMVLMFLEHPVAGSGVGTFTMLLPSFYDKYGVWWGGPTVLEATNHLLHMAATGGLIGLGVTAWLLLAFFLPPVRRVLSTSTGDGIALLRAALLAGASTYVFFSNWQGETWYYVPVATPFWMVLALCVCLSADAWPPRHGKLLVYGLPVVYALAHLLYL